MSELWDCYDKAFQKIEGKILVRGQEAIFSVDEYHLVCDVAVRHADGTYLLMQRDYRKEGYPGKWEFTAGGSTLQGESPEECAKRELLEETGIVADSMREVGRTTIDENHSHYVVYMATVSCEKDAVVLQDGETIDYRWVEKSELIKMKEELATWRVFEMLPELEILPKLELFSTDRIEWLFFDVGSTLLSEEKAYLHRLQDVAEAVNEPFENIYEMAIAFYRENKKGDLEVMQAYGLPKLTWYKEDEVLYPETVLCLEKLSKRYKIGIIANQSLGTADRLEQHGILKYIDLVVASAEEGVSKPDRRIFEIALQRAGCRPESAVMIGDRIDNDIVPAKKMGMKTVWIKQGFGKYWQIRGEEEKADYEVHDLNGVIAVFE